MNNLDPDDVLSYIDRLTCDDCMWSYTYRKGKQVSSGCAGKYVCDQFSLSGSNGAFKNGLLCGKLWRSWGAPERDSAIRKYIREHGTLKLTGDGGRVFYEPCSRR